jgi:hypothetical protein
VADGNHVVGEIILQAKNARVQTDARTLHAHNGVGYLTIYIQLQLLRCRISHAQRLRPPISLKPWESAFRNVSFSPHAGYAERALKLLEMTRPYDFCEFSNLAPPFVRANAYLQMHDGYHAAAEFQSIIDHSGVDPTNPKHALARLGLARALVQDHNTILARRVYRSFLEDWRNGDSDISDLRKSRTEIANLH